MKRFVLYCTVESFIERDLLNLIMRRAASAPIDRVISRCTLVSDQINKAMSAFIGDIHD